MAELKVVRVKTEALYNDITTKNPYAIYFIEDIKKIIVNGVKYGFSNEDASKFLKLTGGTMTGNLIIEGDLTFGDSGYRNINEVSVIKLKGHDSINNEIHGTWDDDPNLQGEKICVLRIETDKVSLYQKGSSGTGVIINGIKAGKYDDEAVNVGQLNEAVTDKLGTANGIATLDNTGKVPSNQLPSYVDDVLSYATRTAFPATGESGKIYVSENDNKTWRWTGTTYVEISASLALGETSSTAYRGDRGKIAYDHSQKTIGNPHNVSKGDVGLGNVQNYGIASQNDAEFGYANNLYMTPLRTKQAIEALAPKIEWEIIE